MPFRSKAQMRYLYATHPEIAREFAAKTPSTKGLPEHVKRHAIHKRLSRKRGHRHAH